jgi:hypothetical protein
MWLFVVNPRFWVVLFVVFTVMLGRRLWVQWRASRLGDRQRAAERRSGR